MGVSGYRAASALVAALALTACSGDAEPSEQTTGAPTPPAPNVAVPSGVELTEAGTELALGEPAAVIFKAGRGRVGTIKVEVTDVDAGSMRRDFTNFALSAKELTQVPYYVRVRLTNTGPAELGEATPPVWALDTTDTYFPPTGLVGDLPACPGGPLPARFATGDSVTTCLLFLAEAGTAIEQVQLRPYAGFDPVWWAVPTVRGKRVQQAAAAAEARGTPARR